VTGGRERTKHVLAGEVNVLRQQAKPLPALSSVTDGFYETGGR
jgi:hypothetical protein